MKAVVTGHTKGIGLEIFRLLQKKGYDVIGISRQTGYDLYTDVEKVVETAKGCDLFVNNTKISQTILVEKLHDKVDKMIVMGSIAGDYSSAIDCEYSKQKLELQSLCHKLSLRPNTKIVHLKISMLEDSISTDVPISFTEIVEFIDFWITYPSITSVEYSIKLTDHTLQALENNLRFDKTFLKKLVDQTFKHT